MDEKRIFCISLIGDTNEILNLLFKSQYLVLKRLSTKTLRTEQWKFPYFWFKQLGKPRCKKKEQVFRRSCTFGLNHMKVSKSRQVRGLILYWIYLKKAVKPPEIYFSHSWNMVITQPSKVVLGKPFLFRLTLSEAEE